MTTIQKHKFHTLDAMRGVAAMIVVIFHFQFLLPLINNKFYPADCGYLAVDLFFLLSGYVIAFAYDEQLSRGLSVKNFTMKRLIRLWPMIWIGSLIGAVDIWVYRDVALVQAILAGLFNATLLPYPINDYFTPTNGAEWSLLFEIAANILFAAAFFWLRGRALLAVITVSAVSLVLIAIHFDTVHEGYSVSTLYAGIARVGFSFFFGVLIWRTRGQWSRYTQIVVVPAWAVVIVTAIVLMLPVPSRLQAAYDLLFVLVGSPLLVMLGSQVEPGEKGTRVAAQLGVLSYPLYATHQPIRDWVEDTIARPNHSTSWAVIAVMVLTVPLSFLLAYCYDAPLRKWLSRRWHLRASNLP